MVKMWMTMCFLAAALLVGCGEDPAPTAVLDTTPPAVPDGLTVRNVAGLVTLSWAPNTTDADFAGFRVERVNGGQSSVLVPEPQGQCGLTDRPPRGVNVYQVTSVDVNGNESAGTAATITVVGHHLPLWELP